MLNEVERLIKGRGIAPSSTTNEQMTVSRLISKLKHFHPDSLVYTTVCPLDGEAVKIKDIYADCVGVMIEIGE